MGFEVIAGAMGLLRDRPGWPLHICAKEVVFSKKEKKKKKKERKKG
jgi:hypothetical protein